jgi:hypothetical protein
MATRLVFKKIINCPSGQPYKIYKTEKNMKNPLSLEQQARLKAASSGLTTEEFSKLSLAETNEIANRIDKVILDLHKEIPFAFRTYAFLDEKNKVVFQDQNIVGTPFINYVLGRA